MNDALTLVGLIAVITALPISAVVEMWIYARRARESAVSESRHTAVQAMCDRIRADVEYHQNRPVVTLDIRVDPEAEKLALWGRAR
jgi:hypothetical protein